MYDYHTHSAFSDDCSTPMRDVIEAACDKGLKEIAVTDHYDPDYPDRNMPFELDFPEYHKALNDMKETFKNRIKVLQGVEIAIQHGSTLEKCKKAAKDYDYDFIIGSFHCAEGIELHRRLFYENRPAEDAYIAYYTYIRDCLKNFHDYDILGHINYIDRYTDRVPSSSVYMDLVEDILKNIISDGKGIEINTSSSRFGMGDKTTPSKEILKLYCDLGGEIVTIGSDAHKAEYVGDRLDEAVEMMKSAGLKYLATYDQRKLNFIKLDSI